jgi:transmembrane sensor
MIALLRNDEDARRDAAAAWVVRLEAGDLPELEASDFDAWLCASPANPVAFDDALCVSRAYAAERERVSAALSRRRAPRPDYTRRAVGGMGAMAAAAALAVVLGPQLAAPSAIAYETSKGERRTVALADGSTIVMNGGTRLSVRIDRNRRDVTLGQGQALFDVAHDAGRPFTVAAGDRNVRVLGTQFDVRRLDGQVEVSVARGAVEVRPADGAPGRSYRLRPGQRFAHAEGASQAQVGAVETAEVGAWTTGRLVYRGAPLRQVVADLNQQFATPIRLADAALADETISGVLVIDDQQAVIRRLALLVPVSALPSETGIVLRRDPASGSR